MKKKLIFLMTATIMIFNLLPMQYASAAANINIGDYVQMGTYYGQPILWRCVDIDANGPLMLSDRIICLKPFDASGTNTSGSHGRGYCYSYNGQQGYYRRKYGSNYWADSNIRDWLNSTASAGNVVWTCGNPPDNSHVLDGYNDYASEAGFLTNFSDSERNAIKTVTQKSLLDGYEHSGSSNTINSNYHRYDYDIYDVVQNYDTAYSEQVTDKMFLLDVKQINAVYNNRGILGSDYYIGQLTAEAIANSEYHISPFTTKWWSWLRSPDAYDPSYHSYDVRNVLSVGNVDYIPAYFGYGGVRPAFYLNLSSCNLKGGEGTEGSPYTVSGGGGVSYNNRSSASNEVSITVMKNNKDMTDSSDDYVEAYSICIPKQSTEIKENGYYTEKINGAELSDGDKIYLEKSGMNVPILRGVFLNGKDIRRDELVSGSSITGKITAEIDWNGQKEKIAYIDNGITQVRLTNGETDSINWDNFVKNAREICIVLKTVNGYTTKKKLHIKFEKGYNLDKIECNIFDSIGNVGSGVIPYLDDLKFSFDIPNFKLDFSVNPDDNTVKGVFGVDVAEWAYENNLRDKEDKDNGWDNPKKQNAYKTITKLIKDTAKEMEKSKKDKTTLVQDYKNLKKQLGKAHQKTTAKFGFDADINVVGYLEGKMDHDGLYVSDAGIIVTIEAKGSVSGEGIIWVIPYNWKVGASAEANLNLQLLQREIRSQMLSPQGSIAVTIAVSAEGGPGIKAAHLNLGGKIGVTPKWQFAPSSVFTLDAKGSLYFEAVAGPFSYHKDFVEKTWQLYPRPKKAMLMSIGDAYDTDIYTLRERNGEPSNFVANKKLLKLMSFAPSTHTDKIIKTNSYDVSTPQYIGLSDGKRLLVWLDDDKTRGVINGTSIMYSIYDGAVWSEPLYVESDGSGDYSPMLKMCGDEIYLVWEDIDIQPDNASMEDTMKAMDIKCAKFDNESGSFVDIMQLTNDSNINSAPQIGVSDDDLIVSWITNTSDNLFETSNTYGVDYAVIENGQIKSKETAVSNINSVDSHIAVLKNGNAEIYYIKDTDGDLATVGDNVLYSTKSGEVTDSNVSGLCNWEDVIYYYGDGKIKSIGNSYLSDFDVAVSNNHYCIADNGKTVLLTAQNDSGNDIYAYFYDENEAKWGEAVRLTDLGCTVTDINGFADENGEINLAFNKKSLASEGSEQVHGTSDLAILSFEPLKNITLKDVYTERSNIIPGDDITINIEAYNSGEKAINNCEAVIYDKNGNEVSRSAIDAKLMPGETGEYEITYSVPENFSPSEITLELDIGDDYNQSDNSMDLMLDFNNLAIVGLNSVKSAEGYNINAVITNTGFNTENNIEVALLKDSNIIETQNIASIESLEKQAVKFADVAENAEYVVKITEKDNEDILVDNEEVIITDSSFENTDTEGYIKELDYSDGKITAEISMFNANSASKAYFGVFDSIGKLVAIDTKEVNKDEKTFHISIDKELSFTDEYIVKLMLWDNNLKPFMVYDKRELLVSKTILTGEVLESSHSYANNSNETKTYTYGGNCESIDVTFSAETETESGWDYIYIYDVNDNQIGQYSGTTLAGKTINIPGNTVKIRLTSDGSVTKYGYRTESIIVNR